MSSLRCTLPGRVVVAKQRSRRAVVVKALSLQEATNMVAQAFVRIFSPPDDKVDSKSWPQGQWTGKISRGRRPFKDGFVSDAPLPAEPVAQRDEADAAGYVSDAVKNVVSGFPSQPPTEPTWSGLGWKGELHSTDNKRNARDGFHVKKN